MTPESAALVRASWAAVAPRVDALAADFLARLFALDPDARALFARVDLPTHRAKFVAMLDHLVAALDDPGLLVSETVPTGRRHGGYGVTARDYAAAGTALQQALAHALGPRFTPAVHDAWEELYALLAAVMQRASSRAASSGDAERRDRAWCAVPPSPNP